MKSPPPTPSNNVEASLHTLTTLFKGVRGECLTCTCLFDSIYFGQDCRTLDLKIQKQISPSTNINASVGSQKPRRKLHMKVFEKIKESKWEISCKSI